MQYEYTEYSPHGLEMLEKQELCKDYMQGLEPCWKLCDAPFLALWERESRHFNDESTSIGTILAAYKDFEDRFEIVEEKLPAIEMVRKATQQRIGKFNKQDIRELCPALSVSSIEGSLRKLVAEGELRREGRGKSTFYVRLK